MAFITQVGTAVPEHAIDQNVAAATVAKSLRLGTERTAALEALFEHTRVHRRRSIVPLELVGEPRSLTDRMVLYRRHALELALAAARRCLEQAGVLASSIDLVVTSSCTGLLLPSLATLLVEPLGLRQDVRRLPLTELGCAGGASALAQAYGHVRAFPGARVLVVAVELPSLTFQTGDASSANLVASALFGDGAAAVLVESGAAPTGVEIVAARTGLMPASLDDMGFDLRDSGLHVVLSKNVPSIIATRTPPLVREFLAAHGLALDDLRFFVLHPGGRRVLEALETGLGLERAHTKASWDVLHEYGNQSSASVLFVLQETLGRGVPAGYGLLAAFGPGITAELVLLRGLPC